MTTGLQGSAGKGLSEVHDARNRLHVSWRELYKSKKTFALNSLMMLDQGKVSDQMVGTCLNERAWLKKKETMREKKTSVS